MSFPAQRTSEDFGFLGAIEASRYIQACDYLENNEYWCFAAEAIGKLQNNRQAVVVDIGCGPGTLCECLRLSGSNLQMIGVDASKSMILHAKDAYPECQFIQGRAEALPLPSESVDMVVCLNTLHHLPDVDLALAEMLRVLKPRGVAFCGDLRRDAPAEEIVKKLNRMHTAVAEDLKRSVRSALTPREIVRAIKNSGGERIIMTAGPRPANFAKYFSDPYMHELDWPLYYRVWFMKYSVT